MTNKTVIKVNATMKLETNVEFGIPGTDHRQSFKIAARHLERMSAMLPHDCPALRFYDVISLTVKTGGRTFSDAKIERESPYYYVGTAVTPEEIEKTGRFSEEFVRVMRKQIEYKNYVSHIQTVGGGVYGVKEGGIVMAPPKKSAGVVEMGHNMSNLDACRKQLRKLLRTKTG